MGFEYEDKWKEQGACSGKDNPEKQHTEVFNMYVSLSRNNDSI